MISQILDNIGEGFLVMIGKREIITKLYRVDLDDFQIKATIDEATQLMEILGSLKEESKFIAKNFKNIAEYSEVVARNFTHNYKVQDGIDQVNNFDFKYRDEK